MKSTGVFAFACLIVALVTISVAMAFLLYVGQIAYMVVFALLGVIIATYAWLMAKLLNQRLSGWAFQVIWALTLAGSLLGEGWGRSHKGLAQRGLLPAAVAVFEQWKSRDQIATPIVTRSQPGHAKPVPPPPTHESIIDNSSVRADLTALLVAELCNNADLVIVRTSITRQKVSLPFQLVNGRDINESLSLLQEAQKNQAVLIDIADNQLQNYRLALDRGKGILGTLTGANASLIMRDFTEGQEKLISNAESWKATIVPIYQTTAELMTLAIKAKSQSVVSREARIEWAELTPKVDKSHELNGVVNTQAESDADIRKALGKLIGETLPYDPHQFRVFGHCTRLLPSSFPNDQANFYENQIMARWDSNIWLTEGRDQQAYRQQ